MVLVVMGQRMVARKGHFMEELSPEERAIMVDVGGKRAEIVGHPPSKIETAARVAIQPAADVPAALTAVGRER
jgi:hypothetical protein